MKPHSFFTGFFLLAIARALSFGQGCSDAGGCSLNAIRNIPEDSAEYRDQVSLGISYGTGDFSVRYISPYIEYSRVINEKLELTGKFTCLNSNGELSNVSGLSDLFFTGSYKIVPDLMVTAGMKIPLSAANRESQGNPLPMHYQTSLGTFDLLAGLSFSRKQLGIAAALQVPLTRNRNKFLAGQFPINAPEHKYPSARRFTRRPDLIGRASYHIPFFKRKVQLAPTLLPIWHLADDLYTDAAGQKTTLHGSMGLTLNALVSLRFSVSGKSVIEFSYARPFITRDLRPDGLTRHAVIAGEYRLKF